MINTIAAIYSSNLKKISISSGDRWSLTASLSFLKLLVNPKQKGSYLLSEKFFPGNRFRLVQKINQHLLMFLVRKIVQKTRPHLLWIYSTEFYAIHNKSHARILVLSCDKKYLQSRTPQMCYRDLFQAGWVFAYILGEAPRPLIFKNKSEKEIIKELVKSGLSLAMIKVC